MILALNLVLEATALYVTWPLRIFWLRMYLVIMFGWAIASSFVDPSSLQYFYIYWTFESTKFITLAVLATHLLISKSVKSTRSFSIMWGYVLLGAIVMTTYHAWGHNRNKIHYLTLASFLCSGILVAALANKQNRAITIGALTGTLSTFTCGFWPGHFGTTYPLVWVLPLLIWISPIVARGKIAYDSIGGRERHRSSTEGSNSTKSGRGVDKGAARVAANPISARPSKA